MSTRTTKQPIDSTKREHVARLSEIKWCSPESDYVILGLHDGRVAKGTYDVAALQHGETYRFLGNWQDDVKYGPFFRFDAIVRHEPARRESVIRYLSKLCDDIGEGRAAKLFDAYGSDTCRVMREETDRVVRDGIISEATAREAAKSLQKEAMFEQTKIDLYGLFAGRGFPGKLIEASVSEWGIRAPDSIRRNPFALLVKEMPGAGFKRCDKLWIDLELPSEKLKRQFFCGWNALRTDRNGHTWVSVQQLEGAINGLISFGASPVKAIKLGVRAGWLTPRRDENRQLWIAERQKAQHEMDISRHAHRLLAGGDAPTLWPAAPLPGIDELRTPSDHQNAAWESIRTSPLAILTGGPGTGKTFTVAAALRAIVQRHGVHSVGVCAPTGKAAVRCTQAMQQQGLPLRAVTIHTMLGIQRNGHDGKGWGFAHNEKNPLPYRFLIVDESSMIDADLMSSLLAACGTPPPIPARAATFADRVQVEPPRCRRCHRELTDPADWPIGFGRTCRRYVKPDQYDPVEPREIAAGQLLAPLPEIPVAGTHVLLVGDPHQLPPVGHGAPLRDLIAAGAPCGELTEIRRNAGTIVRACAAIKAGKPPMFNIAYDPNPDDPRNLILVETATPEQSWEKLYELLMRIRSFNPVWQTQVLIAVNKKSPLSRVELNGRLQALLNPSGREEPGHPFRLSDKIICLKNGWYQAVEPVAAMLDEAQREDPACYQSVTDEDGERVETYVANGETGRVEAIGPKITIARMGESDTLIKIAMGKIKDPAGGDDSNGDGDGGKNGQDEERGQGCNFDLAYAITTHKSQGSESPCVVCMIDDAAGSVANREWWYTALSRASKLCVVIGNRGTLEKQAKKIGLQKRKTFLTELLREKLGNGA